MKCKSLIILFAVPLFFVCNNEQATKEKIADTITTTNVEAHEKESHEDHAAALSLNNNAKWETDESTRTHAAKLNASVNAFTSKTNNDAAAYQAFSVDMQKELDALISDCKMKGPEHEALHSWLQPVLKDVSDLKKIQAADAGKIATEKLTADVKKFNQYFN